MRVTIDLTGQQRAALLAAIAPYADAIDRIDVFGSRATGRARPGSDVDLVVHGSADAGDLKEAIAESMLSIFADVVQYDTISNPRLRDEIDRHALPLFDHETLTSFAAGRMVR